MRALERRLLPRLGGLRLSALTQAQLQGLVDGLLVEGRSASTVRNALLPLRAIYGHAVARVQAALGYRRPSHADETESEPEAQPPGRRREPVRPRDGGR